MPLGALVDGELYVIPSLLISGFRRYFALAISLEPTKKLQLSLDI